MKDPLRSANAKKQPRTPSGQWTSTTPAFNVARGALSSEDSSDIKTIVRECQSGRLDQQIMDTMRQVGVNVDQKQWESSEELRQGIRNYYAQRYEEAYRH